MKQALLILPFLLCGCSNYWTLQRSEGFVNEKNHSGKIICLSPLISFQSSENGVNETKLIKLQENFESGIVRSSKQNKINLVLQKLDENSTAEYYTNLLALKQNLVEVNFNNYSSVNSSGLPAENKLVKNIYIYPPKISFDFNNYSQKFGTKYFSFLKVVIQSNSFTFYHVIVDTDLSETVFSERKVIHHKFKQDLLDQVIYDSFSLLSKDINI